jgi:hypothetical protein
MEKEMTFLRAVAVMQEGSDCRRPSWYDGKRARIQGDSFQLRYNTFGNWQDLENVPAEWLFSKDWERCSP